MTAPLVLLTLLLVLPVCCFMNPLNRCRGCHIFDPPFRALDYADYEDSERLDTRSICPWTTIMIADQERIPRQLPSTTCTKSSVVFDLNGTPVEYTCQLVEVTVPVLKYHRSGYWERSEDLVSVACTAVQRQSWQVTPSRPQLWLVTRLWIYLRLILHSPDVIKWHFLSGNFWYYGHCAISSAIIIFQCATHYLSRRYLFCNERFYKQFSQRLCVWTNLFVWCMWSIGVLTIERICYRFKNHTDVRAIDWIKIWKEFGNGTSGLFYTDLILNTVSPRSLSVFISLMSLITAVLRSIYFVPFINLPRHFVFQYHSHRSFCSNQWAF